jgi:hypothetical protein
MRLRVENYVTLTRSKERKMLMQMVVSIGLENRKYGSKRNRSEVISFEVVHGERAQVPNPKDEYRLNQTTSEPLLS